MMLLEDQELDCILGIDFENRGCEEFSCIEGRKNTGIIYLLSKVCFFGFEKKKVERIQSRKVKSRELCSQCPIFAFPIESGL